MSNTINPNKTIEIYNYSDSSAKTEINFNDEIIFNQIDIEDIKILYKHGIIFIEGYIRHGDSINEENILKLNQWSREKGDSNKWLKRTNIKIVRNEFVVRDLTFNAFIVDYLEYFKKGKHRFTLVLRQYKLAKLDGTRGDTGANKTDSYVKTMKLKGVDNTVVITPVEQIDYKNLALNAVFTGSNPMTAYGMYLRLGASNPLAFKFFLIAHGTGLISEFIADVYFVATGRPEKMGSFNMTRDHFYKHLGNATAHIVNKRFPTVKFNDSFGEDIHNLGNLMFCLSELGIAGLNHVNNFIDSNGIGYLFSIKIKAVKTSRFGRVLQPVKYIGLTPLKATKNLVQELGFDAYTTGKALENEVKKAKDKEPKDEK